MKRILIVDDEINLCRMLSIALKAEGFECLSATTAGEAIRKAFKYCPDLIILDLGLPDSDGETVLRRLRETSRVPVIVLSARDAEHTKVALLNAGANDYVSKPFGVNELIARINVLLRDLNAPLPSTDKLLRQFTRLRMNVANQQVWLDDRPLDLSPKEFAMLSLLTSQPGQLILQQQLLQEIWGVYHTSDSHYLRILVSQLRKKLNDNSANPVFIETVAGQGYRFIDAS
ncbi:response regulator transcription factor [Salinimonas lutimaris]|uniref:response regulator transcription factor n=1 Tax=Salinimonas lutimaris TaxID=914153 RepID=UPI0010C149B6|nr:response regulator transcription factor [Salinimonas lutimaris]